VRPEAVPLLIHISNRMWGKLLGGGITRKEIMKLLGL
jgi:hypothetical protein